MSAVSAQTFDELFALEEMDAFLKKAQEKCRAKVAHQKFAGMETDDVVQEVLIKVYRSMQRYDGTLSKVSTYVDHVMDNMIRDCLRKAGSKTNLSVVNAFDLLESAVDTERNNADGQEASWSYVAGCSELGYEQMELITDVMEHMHLNERERDVFRMRLSGYEFVEIAEKIGVSKARVSQIWKAIRGKYVSL
jgi:RNA polymerase sporulation-specific sigma factor